LEFKLWKTIEWLGVDSRIQGNCEAEEALTNEKKARKYARSEKTNNVSVVICAFLEKSHILQNHTFQNNG